jgi:hypothetical protein
LCQKTAFISQFKIIVTIHFLTNLSKNLGTPNLKCCENASAFCLRWYDLLFGVYDLALHRKNPSCERVGILIMQLGFCRKSLLCFISDMLMKNSSNISFL